MSKIVVNGHFKVVLVKQLVLEVETLRIPGSSIQASPLAADLGEKRQVFTSVSEKAFCTSCASTSYDQDVVEPPLSCSSKREIFYCHYK